MSGLLPKAIFVLVALAALGSSAPYQQQQGGITVGKAVYYITNDKENAVVALPIAKNGTLSKGTFTRTGGSGSIAINGATGRPSDTDALVSQSALTVAGHSIFAVNAGSNTLTMLAISADDPTGLIVVGKSMALPGEFPNTVAASFKNKLVCVGMTGAKAGISCASFSPSLGLDNFDKLRPFDIGQSTPPVGPTNTVSQTWFSNDQSTLFTTVKGDPTKKKAGFLSVFKVKEPSGLITRSMLSTQENRSSPSGTAVLFGSASIPNRADSLFVTDASFGAAILTLDQKSQASVAKAQAIKDQRATCWATISDVTNSAFVTDVAINRLVEMSLDDASIISSLDLSTKNPQPGLTDLQSAGSFIYALAPGNGMTKAAVTVIDVSGGQGSMKLAQHFGLDGIAGNTAMGMAILM